MAVTIDKPNLFMVTNKYFGEGSVSQYTHQISLKPDLTIVKNRESGSNNWGQANSVSGVTKMTSVNNDAAENTDTAGIMAFGDNAPGGYYTVGNTFNVNNAGYVGVSWKAGTAVSGNTGGSGTSKSYSGTVNTTSGFSIIQYDGNGTTNHKIPHHLGVRPNISIIKNRDSQQAWPVNLYSNASSTEPGVKQAGVVYHNQNDAVGGYSDSGPYPTGSFDATHVKLGSAGNTNLNNESLVMYTFAEVPGYSRITTYKGNGNTSSLISGTMVYCGFKPEWFYTKSLTSSTGGSWIQVDRSQNPLNQTTNVLSMSNNQGNSDWGSSFNFDILSTGFKLRASPANGYLNTAGYEYMIMAFAENPLVTTSGVPATARC